MGKKTKADKQTQMEREISNRLKSDPAFAAAVTQLYGLAALERTRQLEHIQSMLMVGAALITLRAMTVHGMWKAVAKGAGYSYQTAWNWRKLAEAHADGRIGGAEEIKANGGVNATLRKLREPRAPHLQECEHSMMLMAPSGECSQCAFEMQALFQEVLEGVEHPTASVAEPPSATECAGERQHQFSQVGTTYRCCEENTGLSPKPAQNRPISRREIEWARHIPGCGIEITQKQFHARRLATFGWA